MSLLIVAVLTILATSIYTVTRHQVHESVYQKRLAQAQYIADTGLEDALYQLYLSTSWRTGFNQKPFVGGYYTVTLTGDPPNITSTGSSALLPRFGRATRTVKAQAHYFWNSGDVIHVSWEPGTWTDSYSANNN